MHWPFAQGPSPHWSGSFHRSRSPATCQSKRVDRAQLPAAPLPGEVTAEQSSGKRYTGDMVKKAPAGISKDPGTRRSVVVRDLQFVPSMTAAPRSESQAEIREWARAQGCVVGDRGDIPAKVRPMVVSVGGESEGWVGVFAEGVSLEDPRALVGLVRGRLQHQERVAANFDILVAAMMPSLSETDIVPTAMVAQAQKRAELRSELLATGALTYKALAEGRRMTAANLRQWVRRARERYELFTVEYDNETLVPAFLLDADLLPRPAFQPVIAVLAGAGEDGWGLWTWLVHPTSWLDGKVPAEELQNNAEAVLRAAQDRATNAA